MDCLRGFNRVAVCSPDGAGGKSKWLPSYTEALRGKSIAVIQDNDPPGKSFAIEICNALHGVAKSVKLIDLTKIWPELPEYGDATDLIEHMGERGAEAISQLVADTPEYKPSTGDVFGRMECQGNSAPRKALKTISAKELQAKDIPTVKYVVSGFLPHGLALLAAPPKFGKSWWVLDLCLAVAAGKGFLKYKTEKCGCLYLALEDSEYRLKDRMNKILGHEKAPEGFDYAIAAHDIQNGLLEELESYINDHPDAGLIVIDTLQKVRSVGNGRENAYQSDYKEVGALKAFADKHNICLLLVHHLRKAADDADPFNRISSTNGIFGAADTAIVLSRAKRGDTQTTMSIVGRDIESSDTVIAFKKESYRWNVVGDANWLAEQRAFLEYKESPIVKTIVCLLERNPAGWRGTAQELLDAGKHYANAYIANTPRELSNKLRELDKPLFEYGNISHERARNGSGGATHKFYFTNGTLAETNGTDAKTNGMEQQSWMDGVAVEWSESTAPLM